MVRMTDLLKKRKDQTEYRENEPPAAKEIREESPPAAKEETPIVKETFIEPTVYEKEKAFPDEAVEFAEILLKGGKKPLEREDIAHKFMSDSLPDREETKKLYFEALEDVVGIFSSYKNHKRVVKEDILRTASQIVHNVMGGPGELLKLVHEIESPLEFHRCYNAINCAILSVAMGMVYKYNKSTLLELAVIATLHDIALMENKNIINLPRRLTAEEFKEIKKHALTVAEFVEKTFDFKKEMVDGVLQHHERKNGQGYPSGLREGNIKDLAMIVGIADTYEALTHFRPYKEKLPPHQAILTIISEGKSSFTNQAVKALTSCVGLYPVGSLVMLNTGEICRVLTTNLDFPLRPVVSVFVDKDGTKCKEPRTIDLKGIPTLYIKEIVENQAKDINKGNIP